MSGMQICEVLWTAFLVVWIIWAIRTKATRAKEGVESRLSYTALTIAAFFLMFTRSAPAAWVGARTFPEALWVDILGVAITVAGLALAVSARAYLGGNWSSTVTVKVGHQLIRSGPYRWVRHPIYSGMILAMFGTALPRREWRGLLAVALLYVGFKIKSRIEERTMVGEFGAEYTDDSRRTGAIFPRVRG